MKKFLTFIVGVILTLFAVLGGKILMQEDQPSEEPPLVIAAERLIPVPVICQYPTLPTGCEATAAAMVLQFYGEDISAEGFAKDWLECNKDFYKRDNRLYGPDPREVFAGDPFSVNSYGCFATPIVKAINGNSLKCVAEEINGKSLAELCKEYIDNGKPLLIWATMGMREPKEGRSWRLENGTDFTWISGEHCLVLVGYNEDYYFFNDPQSGSTAAYLKDISEKRFAELGTRAVYIYKRALH